jgi:hypothetical protein
VLIFGGTINAQALAKPKQKPAVPPGAQERFPAHSAREDGAEKETEINNRSC